MGNVQAAVKEFKGLSAEQTKKKILSKQNTKGEGEDEELSSHGNTGLPFGLCKKHGIALPEGATPRDAWDALRGVGIYPPWTDKGKGQYKSEGEGNGDSGVDGGEKEEISADKQKLYNGINQKLSKFPQEYREKLSQALSNLTDDEIAVIAHTMNNVDFASGSGSFRWGANTITIPTCKGTALDEELGYDFQATTFFHEYGHYLASVVASSEGLPYRDFNESPEMQRILAEDAQNLLTRVVKEMGLAGTPALSRIKQEYKYAFRDYLNKLTDKDIAHAYEPSQPQKRDIERERPQLVENQMRWWGKTREQAEAYVDDLAQRTEASHQEALKDYQKRMEWWNSVKDRQKEAKAKHERYGFVSDFIAGATGGRINPQNYGHWGHSDSYWKGTRGGYVSMPGHKDGIETWAEYVSLKMSKDQKGLQAFQELLPQTHAKYEQMYSKLREVIK